MRLAPFRLAVRDDESLYSVLARWSGYLGDPPTAHFVKALYGKSLPIYDDLPVGMARLAAGGWLQGSAREEVKRSSAYPYYAAFANGDQREAGMRAMLDDGPWPHEALRSWRVEAMPPDRFRFCPACLTAMLAGHPDPWWRRAHQLPTVLVCPDHCEVLLDAPIGRKRRRQRYVAAGSMMDTVSRASNVEPWPREGVKLAAWLATASRDLLVGGHGMDVVAIRSAYRRMLSDAIIPVASEADLQLAAADVVWFWRPVLDRKPDWMKALNSDRWLSKVLDGGEAPPLHHLMLRVFLERG